MHFFKVNETPIYLSIHVLISSTRSINACEVGIIYERHIDC